MTNRERLHAEIDSLDDQNVDAVYQLVRLYMDSSSAERSGNLIAKLKNVKIDAPSDFALNLDLYLNGEKSVQSDVH